MGKGNTKQSDRQTSLFKLLKINKEIYKVQLPSRPTNFRTISVKPYLQPELEEELTKELTDKLTKELAASVPP